MLCKNPLFRQIWSFSWKRRTSQILGSSEIFQRNFLSLNMAWLDLDGLIKHLKYFLAILRNVITTMVKGLTNLHQRWATMDKRPHHLLLAFHLDIHPGIMKRLIFLYFLSGLNLVSLITLILVLCYLFG